MKTRTTSSMLIAIAWFTLSPAARAVNPPPDGGYPNANTAEGNGALFSLTSGFANTAIGADALYHDTIGGHNTATGYAALRSNIGGTDNTATGSLALTSNTTGSGNTADGVDALLSNKTGTNNTANGADALNNNMNGSYNTGTGASALALNKGGSFNTASGVQALFSNTFGGGNTANGNFALFSNTTGDSNTADGFDALFNNTTGSSNIAVGLGAGSNLTTGSNNIDIGALGAAGEANKIRIGKQGTQNGTFIAGISGTAVSGSQVVVNANGKLGVAASSVRFKEAIKPMDKASEAILALKPVTFHYKEEIDPDAMPQFGLIAEEVERVNPDLITRDDDGKPVTVRYEAVNAMLLNEFLKEHQKVVEQEARLAKQEHAFQATLVQQQKEMEALKTGLQKVSNRLQLSGAAPQLVVNDQ